MQASVTEIENWYRSEEKGAGTRSGQLAPAFQQRLQDAHADVPAEECHFYHRLSFKNGQRIDGGWDLNGKENSYLGHVQFEGLRVLEFGPASGYLTFWMESQGADVTVFDLAPDHPPDLVPLPAINLKGGAKSGAVTARQVRNSWWYAHQRMDSNAKAVYGDIYRLPDDMGCYDVSTFGSILLHLSNPFAALQQAARFTKKALIVTDLMPEIVFGDSENSLIEFNPGNEPTNPVNWWRFSPAAIAKMLSVLGFGHVDVHYFPTSFHPDHNPDTAPIERFMFTVVGQRDRNTISRLAMHPETMAQDEHLRKSIPVIDVANFKDAHRRLQEALQQAAKAQAHLQKIQNSRSWKLTRPLRALGRLWNRSGANDS